MTSRVQALHPAHAWIQIAVLAAILGTAVAWLPHVHSEDIPYWTGWMQTDLKNGVIEGYRQFPLEYPPLSRFIMAVPARLASATGISPALALKGSFLVAMLATGALFYWSTRDRWTSLALLASLLLNNVGIGYVDAYVAPLLVLSLHFLRKERWAAAFAILVAAAFVKWQPGILGPFMFVYIAGRLIRSDRKGWIRPAAADLVLPALAIPAVIYLAFGPVLVGAFRVASNNLFVSGNALNLNWIYTVLLHLLGPGTFGPLGSGEVLIPNPPAVYLLPPKILFWGIYLFTLAWCALRAVRFTSFLATAVLGYFTYFMFNTAVHENHLVLLVVPLAYLAHLDRSWIPQAAAIALFTNVNMALFYGFDGRERHFPKTTIGASLLCLVAVAGFVLYLWTFRKAVLRPERTPGIRPERAPAAGRPSRHR